MRVAATPRSVALFEEVPELLRGLPLGESDEALCTRAPLIGLERGPWQPPRARRAAADDLGLLMLDGAVLRRVSLNGRSGAELLGGGDVFHPWLRQPPHETLAAEVAWEVLERTRIAVLDRRFAARVARWPEIGAALLAHATERARMLAFQHVASHIPGLDARLLAVMCAFADRWGRVTSAGILVPLRLTHCALAELVGASRPSVSTALAQLARDGVLKRTPGGWLLDHRASQERIGSPRGPAPPRAGAVRRVA